MKISINEISGILEPYFQNHSEIEAAYLFGSLARGKTTPLSDIDIALIIDIKKCGNYSFHYGYKATILSDIMELLKTNNVDLVILNDSGILLKHRVLYFGKLLYSCNEENRIQFQVDTINQYNDFKQLIKIHNGAGGRDDR